jgi:hypothetical protein
MAVAFGTSLVVASGIVHGMWTGRWQTVDVTGIVAQLQSVSRQVGDWEAVSDGSISQDSQDLAELEGYVMRHYRNRRTGESVGLLLMCGKSGPIAVHPPTACYAGQGYQQVGDVRTVLLEIESPEKQSQLHAFQTAQFQKSGIARLSQPSIYWAWTVNGNWQVPERPRLAFAGEPILFKLYVTTDKHKPSTKNEAPAEERFLEQFLPSLERLLFIDK